MLEFDPKLRCNAESALNDPWIKKYATIEIDKPLAISALNNLKSFRVNNVCVLVALILRVG
mgnify:FL=1